MKKIVFTIALLAVLTVVAFASTSDADHKKISTGQSNGNDKADKNMHHGHIVVPSDHYSL